MKKAFGMLCGLTILSACSWFEEEKTLADAPRSAPMLNGMAGGSAISPYPIEPIAPAMPIDGPMPSVGPRANPGGFAMPTNGMPADRSMPPMAMGAGSMPMPPEPPMFAGEQASSIPLPPPIPQGGFSARPEPVVAMPLTPPSLPGQALPGDNMSSKPMLVASAGSSPQLIRPMPMPPAPPAFESAPTASEQRRVPEFNRSVLVGGDGAVAAPSVPVMKTAIPAPQDPKLDEYPKLAQVPPAPPVRPSMDTDPRVQAMKDDLARMEGSSVPPAPPVVIASAPQPITPKIISKAEIRESFPYPAAPVASAQMPMPPAPPSPQQMGAMPPAFMAPPPPAGYSAPAPMAPATTSLADLRPLPASGYSTAPAPFAASAEDPYTNANNLAPISSSYKTLPESRYAKFRAAARNSTQRIIQ